MLAAEGAAVVVADIDEAGGTQLHQLVACGGGAIVNVVSVSGIKPLPAPKYAMLYQKRQEVSKMPIDRTLFGRIFSVIF